MSFIEQYRVDMGLGGTSFGFSNFNAIDGEKFICYGDGTTDELFVADDHKEVVVSRTIYGDHVLDARYTMAGDLIEANVLIDSYYERYIKADGFGVDGKIQKQLRELTDSGQIPAIFYINLEDSVIGLVSGDDPLEENNTVHESKYVTENDETGEVYPLPDLFSIIKGEEDVVSNLEGDEVTLVKYVLNLDSVDILFKLNEEDYIKQQVLRKIDISFLPGMVTPKQVKDAISGVFPKNEF